MFYAIVRAHCCSMQALSTMLDARVLSVLRCWLLDGWLLVVVVLLLFMLLLILILL